MQIIQTIFRKNDNHVSITNDGMKNCVIVVYDNGWRSDFPIMYDDERIAYDHLPPKYLRTYVRKAFEILNNLT